MIGTPSRLRLIRNAAALARIDETRDLSIDEKAARRKWKNAPICELTELLKVQKSGQFPDDPVRIKF